MATERVTLTDDYRHDEGRHYRAGDHVLPADIAAGARAKGVVADEPAASQLVRAKAAPKRQAVAKRVRKPAGK